MTSGVGIGLAHDDEDLAVRVKDSGGPPLAAVDDILIAVASNAALDVGGIGRRDFRFGHGEGGANLTGQQRLQPLFLLRC